jgi:hypothetical protein
MPSSPQPSVLSHPWVYSVMKTGGKITFRVEVTDFQPTAGVVEISGQATQEGGAFAPIYATATVPSAPNGDPDEPEEAGRSFVNVDVTENPAYPFKIGEAVTVFVRVSKAWVTVIGPSTVGGSLPVESGQVAPDGTTWEEHLTSAHVGGPKPSAGSD